MQTIKLTVKYSPLSSTYLIHATFWKLALMPSSGNGLLMYRQMFSTFLFFVLPFALADGGQNWLVY
jgi:hypothetical protein